MNGWISYITSWVLWGLAAVGAATVLRWLRHDRVTPLLHDSAEQERLWPGQDHGRWPDCGDPPCDFEDGWTCTRHQPQGKHHPPPLHYSPMPPTVHTITDLENWK